jgi:hypothetical protein
MNNSSSFSRSILLEAKYYCPYIGNVIQMGMSYDVNESIPRVATLRTSLSWLRKLFPNIQCYDLNGNALN